MLIFSFLVGVIVCVSFSLIIFRNINFINFYLSLFIITSPIQILAFTYAKSISIYIYLILIIAFINLVINFKKYKKFFYKFLNFRKKEFNKKQLFVFLSSLFITIFFTFEIWPDNWRFADHDILYFGWLNGIYSVEYSGSLRIPTAYPALMTANHLTPGALILPFIIFCKGSIVNSYKIKFILLNLVFFYFTKTFNQTSLNINQRISTINNLMISNIFLIIVFCIFGSSIHFNLAVSNWPIFILILLFSSLCMIKCQQKKQLNQSEFFKTSILLISFLSLAKAVTFPIFILSTLFLIFYYKKVICFKDLFDISFAKTLAIITLTMSFSIVGWSIQESNHGTLAGAFPICLIDGFSQAEECVTSLFKNPFEGWVIEDNLFLIIKNLLPRQSYPGFQDFIYIWGFCIIPCILLGYFLRNKNSSMQIKYFAMFSIFYGLATAFGVVIFRTSLGYDGMTTAHGYLIIPLFLIVNLHLLYLSFTLNNNLINKIRYPALILVIPALISYSQTWTPNKLALKSIKTNQMDIPLEASLTINDMKKFYIKNESICTNDSNAISLFSNFLDENNCNSTDIKHIFHSMNGIRSNAALDHQNSLINQWVKKDI